MNERVRVFLDKLLTNYPAMEPLRDDIVAAFGILVKTYEQNGKLLVCGNGGSAADAEHVVSELMKEYLLKRAVPQDDARKIRAAFPEHGDMLCKGLQGALPAISLVSQSSTLTAFANDVNVEMAFAQQVYGYARDGDSLLAISTSGNSPNVCNAARVAKSFGFPVVGLTGANAGTLGELCDVTIKAPAEKTYRIQEFHLPIYHCLCAMTEEFFFGESGRRR